MASQSDRQPETVQYASQLAEISAREDLPEQERWNQVAATAQKLADRLRDRHGEVDEHSALGRTPFPRTLTALINEALVTATVPSQVTLTAVYELLRTSANFCRDHDPNRKLLLDATFPQAVTSLLRRYSTTDAQAQDDETPLVVSTMELQVLKVSAGVLLNMSLHFEPMRRYLISVDTPNLLIQLRSNIFPPCLWSSVKSSPEKPLSDIKAEWEWRSGFSSWSSFALNELLRAQDAFRILKTAAVRPLVNILKRFTLPCETMGDLTEDPTMRNTLCTLEGELLSDACSLLESLAIDSESIQKFIGHTIASTKRENGPGPLLKDLTDFVGLEDYPPYWSLETLTEQEKHMKSFEMCKAAIIKTIVEVAGCPSSMDILWDFSQPSGWFVSLMVKWVKLDFRDERNDLRLICATLCLANLARRESHCTALVQPPVSVINDLVPLLDVEADIKVRHGALGLLKHLAQTTATQAALSEAKVLEKLIRTEIWSEKLDMAEPVQLLAIGTVKHLCTNNVENAILLATDKADDASPSSTGLHQILGLVKRTDTVAVKSEGTRAVFQVTRSICSQTSKSIVQPEERQNALKALIHPTVVKVLVELANQGRFKPYFILIIEGVLGLTLLALQPSGAPLVAGGLLSRLPSPPSPPAIGSSSRSTSQSGQTSPTAAPNNLLELLLEILTHETYAGESIPIELRVNTCSLLGSVGRKGIESKDGELVRLRSFDTLSALATSAPDSRLKDAARRAVDVLG